MRVFRFSFLLWYASFLFAHQGNGSLQATLPTVVDEAIAQERGSQLISFEKKEQKTLTTEQRLSYFHII